MTHLDQYQTHLKNCPMDINAHQQKEPSCVTSIHTSSKRACFPAQKTLISNRGEVYVREIKLIDSTLKSMSRWTISHEKSSIIVLSDNAFVLVPLLISNSVWLHGILLCEFTRR